MASVPQTSISRIELCVGEGVRRKAPTHFINLGKFAEDFSNFEQISSSKNSGMEAKEHVLQSKGRVSPYHAEYRWTFKSPALLPVSG